MHQIGIVKYRCYEPLNRTTRKSQTTDKKKINLRVKYWLASWQWKSLSGDAPQIARLRIRCESDEEKHSDLHFIFKSTEEDACKVLKAICDPKRPNKLQYIDQVNR